jgi:hypothetical protein
MQEEVFSASHRLGAESPLSHISRARAATSGRVARRAGIATVSNSPNNQNEPPTTGKFLVVIQG